MENITELRETEKAKNELNEKLKQSHKMEAFGILAGGIAHDFNNILSAILGYSDLALDDISTNEYAYYHLNLVIEVLDKSK